MHPVKFSVKEWKAAKTPLAFLIVIVLQAVGVQAAWPQEPAQPRIEKEITKQEEIYRSRGAEVPDGYITGRSLLSYL